MELYMTSDVSPMLFQGPTITNSLFSFIWIKKYLIYIYIYIYDEFSWDISAFDELPEYMKIYYEALLGVYAEMEDELGKRGQSYRVQYAKQEVRARVPL